MIKRIGVTPLRFLKGLPYIPSHIKVLFDDLAAISYHNGDNSSQHLQAAMIWLKCAQDINQDGGIAAGYSLRREWLPSYPETTGYIIPTFVDYYHFVNKEEYLERAVRMADWLLSIQLQNGAFQGGPINHSPKPIVFNTGQVLQGLIRIYEETGWKKYLEAALKAANWLVRVQDEDGIWKRFTYREIPHVYHTRVAWPLLELYELIANEAYCRAVIKNIDWALSNQEENGWFKNNAFDRKSAPVLHTIAYAIEGLLECAILMQNKAWLEAAIKPAEVLLTRLEAKGTLSGAYNNKWKGTTGYRSLTGEAQMSIVWLKLFQITKDGRYLNVASKINDSLKKLQNTYSNNPGINGGIKGSHPIWGGYAFLMYPNWAAKFFADALLLEKKIKRQQNGIRNEV